MEGSLAASMTESGSILKIDTAEVVTSVYKRKVECIHSYAVQFG
jgi:hypothetical protein